MPQVQAELLKLRSTRTTVGLLLGMVGLVLLTVLLTGLLTTPGPSPTNRTRSACSVTEASPGSSRPWRASCS